MFEFKHGLRLTLKIHTRNFTKVRDIRVIVRTSNFAVSKVQWCPSIRTHSKELGLIIEPPNFSRPLSKKSIKTFCKKGLLKFGGSIINPNSLVISYRWSALYGEPELFHLNSFTVGRGN